VQRVPPGLVSGFQRHGGVLGGPAQPIGLSAISSVAVKKIFCEHFASGLDGFVPYTSCRKPAVLKSGLPPPPQPAGAPPSPK
jgi:hypothetical protein